MSNAGQKFRYRVLQPSYQTEVEDHGRGVFEAAAAHAGAVHTHVDANEMTGTYEELILALRSGEVSKSDLVLSGGSWVTFETSPEFYESCEHVADHRGDRQKRKALWLGIAAAGGVLLLAILRALGD